MKKVRMFGLAIMIASLFSLVPSTPAAAQNSKPGEGNYFILDFNCSGRPIQGVTTGERECTFKDFMTLINRVIDFLLYFAVILATISFVYAGFLLITSGGNEASLKKAKDIFWKVILGFIFAFLAWTIVHFILVSLGVNSDYTLLE